MSPAPRLSITNEAAIKPHESAFQRWSMPDAGELAPQPLLPQPAATDRQDTMDAHMPPSFRVYQPAEMRTAPMRRGSYHAIELDAPADSLGARTLLKWTGIGILAGLSVLTALILVLNLGDEKKLANARATIGKLPEPTVAAAPAAPPVAAKPAVVAVRSEAPLEAPTAKPEAAPAKKLPASSAPKKPVAKKR